MADIQSETDIKLLVDSFYAKVKTDDLLGPIFLERLGDDWENHLGTMYKFWGMALLGEHNYFGQPMAKHLHLPVEEMHFNRWLHLFMQTLNEHFTGPVAGEAMKKAGLIARTFLAKIMAFQAGQPGFYPTRGCTPPGAAH